MGGHLPGEIIANRYEVVSNLGAGGLGDVYLCQDTETGEQVAVKRLKEDIEVEEGIIEQTHREANMLSQLQHTNIIRIIDFGMDNEGFYFVLEYIEGPSLAAVVRQGQLPQDDFLKLASQSLEGLGAAHRKGLLHLDIKPANLMLANYPSPDFTVKILDFGIAKFAHEAAQASQGQTMGSIFYISPEQLKQEGIDTRADLYSLGQVLYQALCGSVAFGDITDVLELVKAHLGMPPIPLSSVNPSLDPNLCQWVHHLLEKEPADRPQTAQEALHNLTKVIMKMNPPEPEEPEIEPEEQASEENVAEEDIIEEEPENEKSSPLGFIKKMFGKD